MSIASANSTGRMFPKSEAEHIRDLDDIIGTLRAERDALKEKCENLKTHFDRFKESEISKYESDRKILLKQIDDLTAENGKLKVNVQEAFKNYCSVCPIEAIESENARLRKKISE